MQKILQADLSIARATERSAKEQPQTQTARSGPTELDPSQLKEVGGGLSPNGTWAKVTTNSPNGTW